MKLPSIYIEACPLIDMAEHEAKSNTTQQNNVWFCKQALLAAREGRVVVYTSILSVAECTSISHELPKPPDDVKRFYEMLLMSGKSGISLVGMTQNIAVKARDIRWSFGVNLKGADCIHVATAQAKQCDEIWTRDGKIAKKKDELLQLGVTVVQPFETKVLPESYRQPKLSGF